MKVKIINILIALVLFATVAQSYAIEKQRANNWCWASAIQDVLAQAGVFQSQAQIAARLDGWPNNRPAYIQELASLLQSYRFRAWQTGRIGTPEELYRTLSSGWKIIAFVRPSNGPVGHYIVLQNINPVTGAVIVSDPWTGRTYKNSLSQLYNGWRWGDSVVVGTPM